MADPEIVQPSPLPKNQRGGKNDTPNIPVQPSEVSGRRFVFGVIASLLGIVVLIFVFKDGFASLAKLEEYHPKDSNDLKAMIVLAVAHGVFVIALAYLGYALLRAAERMFIPRYLLTGADDPGDIIRAILGLDTPVKAALKEVKDIVSVVPGIKFGEQKEEKK